MGSPAVADFLIVVGGLWIGSVDGARTEVYQRARAQCIPASEPVRIEDFHAYMNVLQCSFTSPEINWLHLLFSFWVYVSCFSKGLIEACVKCKVFERSYFK